MKIGDIVFFPSHMKIGKIVSIRVNGSVETLYVKIGPEEYSIKRIKGSSIFNTRSIDGPNESECIKITSIINKIGFIIALVIVYFMFK